jgi:hypothetical protein
MPSHKAGMNQQCITVMRAFQAEMSLAINHSAFFSYFLEANAGVVCDEKRKSEGQ